MDGRVKPGHDKLGKVKEDKRNTVVCGRPVVSDPKGLF